MENNPTAADPLLTFRENFTLLNAASATRVNNCLPRSMLKRIGTSRASKLKTVMIQNLDHSAFFESGNTLR